MTDSDTPVVELWHVPGIDVATGAAPAADVCCRLDLPTYDQIRAALTRRV